MCLFYDQTLCNDSMKLAKLDSHVKSKHGEHAGKDMTYYRGVKAKYEKKLQSQKTINSVFKSKTARQELGLVASYEMYLLIAKCGKAHTIGEDLIKPALLTVFSKTVLKRTDDPASKIPLSNNTVQRRIDEMASDVTTQLVSKLRQTRFTVQVDETTVRDSQSLLLPRGNTILSVAGNNYYGTGHIKPVYQLS